MKVFLDTVGCRLNQSEIERMAREFRAAGHQIVGNMAEADLVVVNTCTVTSQAASDSRQKLRQAVCQSTNVRIVATGCWATMEPQETASLADNLQVVTNERKEKLAADLLGIELTEMDLSLIEREVLPGRRHRIRAFIKAQDGCDAFCTYCVTRLARGKSRGVPLEQILTDIRSAINGGAQEIVLSGVQLGSWGMHFPEPSNLVALVKTILRETDVPRLRLSSIEPWDIDDDFFDMFSDLRLCRHLHMALQSGCAATLKRMGRRLTPREYFQRMELARQFDPEFAITTDVITGFPGETMDEFQESLTFIRQAGFSGGHVFPFSARQGTAAASMPHQVQSKERKVRAVRVRNVLAECENEYKRSMPGRVGQVLWESARRIDDDFEMNGLSAEYIRVAAVSRQDLTNVISPVRFTAITRNGLMAEILS